MKMPRDLAAEFRDRRSGHSQSDRHQRCSDQNPCQAALMSSHDNLITLFLSYNAFISVKRFTEAERENTVESSLSDYLTSGSDRNSPNRPHVQWALVQVSIN
jgi:hypothetical protein